MDRLEILRKIEAGEINLDEGSRLLNELDNSLMPNPAAFAGRESEPPHVEIINSYPGNHGADEKAEVPPDFKGYKIWSWVFFSLSVLLTGISAWWMVSAWQNKPFGAGFWFSWIPFILGIIGMATSFNTRWLHVRVTEKKNGERKNIRISLPLPLGLATWVLRMVPGWLPQEVRDRHVGETLFEINRSITRDQPFYVEVDEEDEHVEIFIG